MWLMTRDGFFSVVKHEFLEEKMIIRARSLDHLQSLSERNPVVKLEILRMADADYRYRAIIWMSDFEKLAYWMASDVNYGNFKHEVGRKNRKPHESAYVSFLHKVWTLGHDMQGKILKMEGAEKS